MRAPPGATPCAAIVLVLVLVVVVAKRDRARVRLRVLGILLGQRHRARRVDAHHAAAGLETEAAEHLLQRNVGRALVVAALGLRLGAVAGGARRAVNVDVGAQLGVLLELALKLLNVAHLLLLVALACAALLLLLLERAQRPLAAAAVRALWKRLAHEDDLGQVGALLEAVEIRVVQVDRRHVVAHARVARVQHIAEVRLDGEVLVVDAHVARARHLGLGEREFAHLGAEPLNVEHDKLLELLARHQRGEGRAVVVDLRHLGARARQRVEQRDVGRHAHAQLQLRNAAHLLRDALRQADRVVAAHGRNLGVHRVLVVDRVGLVVLRHEALGQLGPHRHDAVEKVEALLRGRAARKVEVESVGLLLDLGHGLVQTVLENHLLEKVKGALVVHLLPQLQLGLPRVGRPRLFARVALLRLHDELDDERLLQNDTVEDLCARGGRGDWEDTRE